MFAWFKSDSSLHIQESRCCPVYSTKNSPSMCS